MAKAITVYKAGIVYAVKEGLVDYDDPALDELTVEDADGMPESEGCDTFGQYIGRCRFAGIELVDGGSE